MIKVVGFGSGSLFADQMFPFINVEPIPIQTSTININELSIHICCPELWGRKFLDSPPMRANAYKCAMCMLFTHEHESWVQSASSGSFRFAIISVYLHMSWETIFDICSSKIRWAFTCYRLFHRCQTRSWIYFNVLAHSYHKFQICKYNVIISAISDEFQLFFDSLCWDIATSVSWKQFYFIDIFKCAR